MKKKVYIFIILRKDIPQCQKLAENKAQEEVSTFFNLQDEMRMIKEKRQRILEEQAERERRQREFERKQREAAERARREEMEREAAQRRWNDDSWMDGHWNIHIAGVGSMNYYIDTDGMWIKVYTTLYSTMRPSLDYSRPFTISNGEGRYSRFKVITYRDPKIGGVAFTQLADPNKGLLYDENAGYFRKMR